MECSGCYNPFDKDRHVPRILINCGHTQCSICIQKQIDDENRSKEGKQCKCLECGTTYTSENSQKFPINLALLSFAKTQDQEQPKRSEEEYISPQQPKRNRIQSTFVAQGAQISLCDTHKKKLEAFCDLDKKILCIDCILNENHKNHEILSLDKACQKERYIFEMSLKTALQKESEVQHQIFRIKNHLGELEDSANKNRSEISKIFNEIRQKIIERETMLKKMISDTLESEQSYFKQRIISLEDQMRCIQDLKDEKLRVDNEPVLETLVQSPYRFEIENEANRKVEAITFRQAFSEIKKDDEIVNIVRTIVPVHLRNTLLSGTVSSQIKKKEKQEEAKRREFSKQPHLPVYDYENKFNYKKGYLRDDRVPAFISTKMNQVVKKELDLEKISDTSEIKGMVIGVNQKAQQVSQVNNSQGVPYKAKYNPQQLKANSLGSNDNSPKTQQNFVQQQPVISKKSSQQLAENMKNIKKQQSTITKGFGNLETTEINVSKDDQVNLTQRTSIVPPPNTNMRSSSQGKKRDDYQCTLPQSLSMKKDSPLKGSQLIDTNTNKAGGTMQNLIEPHQIIFETFEQQAQHAQLQTGNQQQQKFNNLNDARNKKKTEIAKQKGQYQNNNTQLGSSISGTGTSVKKKKGKKGEQSIFFEFTNEKLYKQIVGKKKPGQIGNTQKSTKNQRPEQKSNVNQLESNKKNSSSEQSSGQQKNNQKDAVNDSQQEDDFEFEVADDVEEEVQPGVARSRTQFVGESRISGSENHLEDDGISGVSLIHLSPQKKQGADAKLYESPVTIKRDSRFNQLSVGSGQVQKNLVSQDLKSEYLDDQQNRKVEDHFNDESRIPYQNDEGIKSFMYDFGQDPYKINLEDVDMQYKSPIGQEQQLLTPNQYNAQSQNSDACKSSVTHQSLDFDNLFKMKEEYIFVFSGFNEKFLTSVEVFDVTRGIWREFMDICSHRTKFSVLPINEDNLAIFGGKDEFGIQSDDVEEFGIKEMKCFPGDWKLPIHVSGFSSCLLKNGTFALCGGNNGQQILNKFYVFSFKKSHTQPQITELPGMIKAREEFALVMGPDHKLYAIGGFNQQDGCLDSVEAFDFQKQQWEIVATMDEGKRALNAVALPDGIYVLGGYNGKEYLNTVSRYEIFSGKWIQMRPMNTSRGTFSALVSQNCNFIYAVGGFNGSPLDHVERYDLMNNNWEYLAPMKQKRFMHSACITNIEKKK